MQTFTIGIPHGTLIGRLGGNRLVRTSDRVQAIATIMLFLLGVAIIPVVVTLGMSTHQHQTAMYARQAAGVHQTTARVTANSMVEPTYGTQQLYVAQIIWEVNGLPQRASIKWPEYLTAGEHIPVWIDATGTLSGKPMSADQAVMDGVMVAVVLWLVGVGVGVGSLQLLKWRLDRRRDAQWEQGLRALVADGRRR